MQVLDYSVREPTGKAWIAALGGVIATGELLWDLLQDKPSRLFGVRFSDGEVLVMAAVTGVIAVVGLAWLVSLYARPGRLCVDVGAGRLSRVRRPLLRANPYGGPLGEWTLRAVFFSEAEHTRGVFKRLEVRGPSYREAILWTDVPRGEALVQALRAAAPAAYSEETGRPHGSI